MSTVAKADQGAKLTVHWLNESRGQRIVWLLEELSLDYEIKVYFRQNKRSPPELKQVHPLGKSPVITIEAPRLEEPLVLAESAAIVEYVSDHFGPRLIPKRYPDGGDGLIGAETKEWLRFRVSAIPVAIDAFLDTFRNLPIFNIDRCVLLDHDKSKIWTFCFNAAKHAFLMHYAEGSLMPVLLTGLLTHNIRSAPVPFFLKFITKNIADMVDNKFTNAELKLHLDYLEALLAESPNDDFLCGPNLTGADFMMIFVLEAVVLFKTINETSYPKLYSYVRRIQNRDAYKRAGDKVSEASGVSHVQTAPSTPSTRPALAPCPGRLELAFRKLYTRNLFIIPSAALYDESSALLAVSSSVAATAQPGVHRRSAPMPGQQRGRTSSQDFAVPSTDQPFAHPFGGAEGAPAPQQAFSAQPRQRHETYPATNGPIAPTTLTQASAVDQTLRYSNFGAPQGSAPNPGAPVQFPSGYGFSPGGPLAWDWGNAVDFTDYTPHYEPQGELVQELQTQQAPNTDFSIPLPVMNTGTAHQPPPQTSSAQPVVVQDPLLPPPRPAQRLSVQTGMKRKAASEPNTGIPEAVNGPGEEKAAKRPNKSRASSIASAASPVVSTATAPEARAPVSPSASMTAPAALESTAQFNNEPQKRREPSKGTGPQGRVIDVSTPRRIVESRGGADVLPSGKVFPIQIGSELFRLSGASISSDDRDPDTFRDIALHLQGYHISPRDGEHFVRLFADAQFYSLPRLTKQLFSTDIFIRIGGVPFQIPRDLFSSPGDSPNYFSLGFAQFFSTPSEVFPGLDRNALLRPPSISPPSVPNRSGETFGELVKMLQGYPVEIRNDAHRSQLLRDARYFHLRGLEQRLIPCETSYNAQRGQSEILIRLDDLRQSGVTFSPDMPASQPDSGSGSNAPSQLGVSPAPSSKPTSPSPSPNSIRFKAGTVSYARPYTDDHASTNILILELSSNESTTLHLPVDPPRPTSSLKSFTLDLRATFHGSTLARITSLFSVIASKMGLPATQPLGLMMMQSGGGVVAQPISPANSGLSERRVRVRLDPECYLEIDNAPAEIALDPGTGRVGIRRNYGEPSNKRIKTSEDVGHYERPIGPSVYEWIWGGARDSESVGKDGEQLEETIVLKRAHWRIRVENLEGEATKMSVVLCGVRIEGYSGEKGRNQGRGFLGS
ncbi:hypothetical protein SLS60_011453 [Paraconiothyrium brasiliense]|uniref:Glutathione S-transferase n=1 Tax=Paraconiothyrium brasiliense TaxID=300254 RepID=A0ABR3QJM9_9PLEO